MGGVPSTPRLGGGARPQETADYLIGEFVGEKSFPLASDYWQKLLELPLDLRWPSHRVRQACQLFVSVWNLCELAIVSLMCCSFAFAMEIELKYTIFLETSLIVVQSILETVEFVTWRSLFSGDGSVVKFAMNNYNTRHLAKILIHLVWCLEDCVSAADVTSLAFSKALNALFVSSVFLKYLIENSKTDDFEELYLSLDETEPVPHNFSKGQHVENLVMVSALNFIAKVDVSPGTYLLHQELLNFLLIAMSTQLLWANTRTK
ncbi:hypothetical protein Sango_2936400 [Sesamum angolense]|uniref:Dymeclin n=1 Tax=Sesamum angolense TaxID=2727404 RepID=A0AAE1T5D3_9LAMI|nr:hypothetical protein Sango_2936400 [Sesamum angolense]